MSNKKKIALLNLPIDNNYGGHLQRYALMYALRKQGLDAVHLNCRPTDAKKSTLRRLKSSIKPMLYLIVNILRGKFDIREWQYIKCVLNKSPRTDYFYGRYVKHTRPIYSKKELINYSNFDAYIVGSDQVWRAPMAAYHYGIGTYYFDYLDKDKLRYAYGVSLGVSTNEMSQEEIERLGDKYKLFRYVSVREKSALHLFDKYGWNHPQAKIVLDPTLLLDKQHYIRLIKSTYTTPSKGDLFCYILDEAEEKNDTIKKIAREKNLVPYYITSQTDCSVEQWLRSFWDAKFVITDSFHGLVLSLIFNKPFYLFYNKERGNARFESIMQILEVNTNQLNYDSINKNLKEWREKSWREIQQICDDIKSIQK